MHNFAKEPRAGRMKAFFLFLALAAGLSGPVAAASWGYPAFYPDAQSQRYKGRPGPGPERGEPPREYRQDRRDERRERMNEDERRALHRDLDKANRELYRRRFQQ